ncbi:MAG: hypothetical protein K6L73_00510 [Cellvibrionaceae bacterium]
MLNKKTTATLLITALMSSFANAYSIISTEKSRGIIDSINTAENTIAIINKETGTTEVLPFSNSSKVIIDGSVSTNLSLLESGQNVVVKTRKVSPTKRKIEGKIVAVNHKQHTAKIREVKSNKVVKVKFHEHARVSGLDNANNFSDLRRGQSIVASYSAE